MSVLPAVGGEVDAFFDDYRPRVGQWRLLHSLVSLAHLVVGTEKPSVGVILKVGENASFTGKPSASFASPLLPLPSIPELFSKQ